MIVFTSDHGDYMGDHWMGEKELFHESSVRVPLIIYDPRPEADMTRGTSSEALVEAIDLVPTFLDATGAPPANHRLEGRSLMPILRGESHEDWRDAVFSEIDYGFYEARKTLDVSASDARGYMLRTDRWKYIHFTGFPPQLFNLEADPNEFHDLGRHPNYEEQRRDMHSRLLERLTSRKNRVTMTDDEVNALQSDEDTSGILIGKWAP